MAGNREADWTESGSAVAGLATATRAAESGNRHSISSVSASYSAATIALVQIKFGTTVEWEGYVHNQRDVAFASPLRAGSGQAVSAELAAGAAGVTGTVTITGYSA